MKNLKTLRVEKKLTQLDMATFLGVSRPTYTRYENDEREPDNETLSKIADYFGVSLDYLLGRENEQKKIRSSEEERILKMLYESDELRELIDTAARLTPVELKALSDFVAVRSAELSKEHHE